MPKLSIITAFLNEEGNLPVMRERLAALADNLAPEYSCEFVLVDDHSHDRSPELAQEWHAADPRVRYVRLARNAGSHTAFLTGLAHATGDCAVLLAADLQDPPELVPQLLAEWRKGNQVVWAVRTGREQIPWTTRLTARVYYGLMRRYALPNMPAGGADFFLLDRQVVQALVSVPEKNTSILGLVHYLGFRQTHVEYVKKARLTGVSKWTLGKKVKLFIDSLLSFSTLPLRVIHGLSASLGLATFVNLAFILTALVMGAAVPAAAWIVLAIMVAGTANLFALAILGSYLWRIFDQTRGRPAFLLEQHLPPGETPSSEAAPKENTLKKAG